MDKDLIRKILTWGAIVIVAIVLVRILFWILNLPLWLFIVLCLAGGYLIFRLKRNRE